MKNSYWRTKNNLSKFFLYFILIVVIIISLAPLIWMVSTSLKSMDEVFQKEVHWVPENITWDNYKKSFEVYPLFTWFYNSIFVAVFTLVVTLFCDIMAAYAFAKFEFRGKGILFAIVLASIMMPRETAVIPTYKIIRMMGLVDTKMAIILPQAAEAIGVFLLVQFFKNIPNELCEAASIDGCSRWGILWKIIVPLSKPAISTLAILTIVNSWNNFFWPLIITYSESSITLPVGLASIMSSFSEAGAARSYGLLMAISVISSLPTIIVFLFLQRKIIQGISMTGLKG